MTNLLPADKSAWLSFFSGSGVMGRFGYDLQLTLGSVVYNSLTLMEDNLEVTSRRNLLYDQSLSLRQVKAANFSTYTPPSVGSTYPYLQFGTGSSSGYSSELPFVQVSSFLTSVSDNPFGPRFVYAWYGAGLSNFPAAYSTTLNGAINSSTTSITVTSGINIANNSYITIEAESSNTTEIVFVTAGGGTANLTVTRGWLGTLPSAHSTLATVLISSGLLPMWKLSYPLLTDIDLGILETYFLGKQGRYKSFTFVDPISSASYPNCRFDSDSMEIKYITKNQSSTELSIIQTFGS